MKPRGDGMEEGVTLSHTCQQKEPGLQTAGSGDPSPKLTENSWEPVLMCQ